MFRTLIVAAVLAAVFSTVDRPLRAAPPVFDDFERSWIDTSKWWLGQIRRTRLWIDRNQARRGHRSLAIRVKSDDRDCGGSCQRSEIRIANHLRLQFGDEAWYRFSFKINGEILQQGSSRWVIGQWKQESDGSPFLAQRFDDGVFHITVQDNDCRIIVAHADGHPDSLESHAANLGVGELGFLSDPRFYDCETDVLIEHGSAPPVLPDPLGQWVDMLYRVRGGRDGQGLIEIWADGVFIARVRGSLGYDEAAGTTQYFKIGHYRDLIPATTIIYVDDFARGDTRDAISIR